MIRALWILALTAGCAAQQADPFVPLAEAMQAAQSPLPSAWAPHATLVVSEALIGQVLSEALTHQLSVRSEPVPLTLPPDLTVRAAPRPELRSVTLVASERCDSCLRWDVSVGGTAIMKISNPTGEIEREIPGEGSLSAVVRATVEPHPGGGRRVMLGAADANGWEVKITTLSDLGGSWLGFLSSNLSEPIRHAVTHEQIPSLAVVRLPADGPVAIRDLRVRATADGLALDLAFVIPTAGAMSTNPRPNPHWTLGVPRDTLLGIMQAAAWVAPPQDGVRAVPTQLQLGPGTFAMELTVVPDRRGRQRIFTVHGELLTDAGALTMRPSAVDLPPGTPLGALVERKILGALADTMHASVPITQEARVGASQLRISADQLVVSEEVMFIQGTALLTDP